MNKMYRSDWKRGILLFIGIIAISQIQAQEKYWVYLKDKEKPVASPDTWMNIHALERRIALRVDICDSTDWPLDVSYLKRIEQMGIPTGFQSRWLNAVVVTLQKNEIEKLRKLPFVKEVIPMQYLQGVPASMEKEVPEVVDLDLLEEQIRCMEGNEFISRGINGKGIRIAVFDGGFPGVDTNPVFQHLRDNHQIIKTYDFVKKKDFVYDYMTHGTSVLSCIAGIYSGKNIGLGTGAEFLLARTEIKAEVKAEEEYWMAAMEWADQNGADIISSSLGYTDKRYTVRQMNGRSTLVSRAAAMAARKGMLVINAMGNDGRENWEVMGAPADVDSVLSVGGVDPYTGYHINFSSYGPTSDQRMKPNVCSPGMAMVASSGSVKKSYGTSFSTPLITGFAACVWQLNRDKNNMDIFHLIEKSGHLYPYFDYAHGYGIPQASYFFQGANNNPVVGKVNLTPASDEINITVNDLIKSDKKYMNYLYYHIQNPEGGLKYYAVLDVTEKDVVSVDKSQLTPGCILRVYYKGELVEMKF